MSKLFDFIKENIKVIILIIAIVAFVIYFFNKDSLKKKTTYTVVEGTIEYSVESSMYVLKDETIIEYDTSQAIAAVVEQGNRVSKGDIVASYKNSSYDEYQAEIAKIDEQIQTLVQDLPLNYSSDVVSIDEKILDYSKELEGVTSYLDIQKYKSLLDELAYKKVTILANASPDSSAIRDLLSQREELVALSKQSDNNILSTVSGIVTYKLDGLEGTYDYDQIEEYSIDELTQIMSLYDDSTNDQFGIKIVNNFKTYLLIRSDRSDYDEYITEGSKYKIRILDLDSSTIRATLVSNLQDDTYNYSLFEISNEIESLVDYRKLSCEVIWGSESGMALPLDAIYTDEENKYTYVLMVYGTQYVKVPIKIVETSDSIVIAENLTDDELSELGIETEFVLSLYDELVIE